MLAAVHSKALRKYAIQLGSSFFLQIQRKHAEITITCHAYVMLKIKEVMNIQRFLYFTGSNSNFLQVLYKYCHLISTFIHRYNISILKACVKNGMNKNAFQ